MIETPTLAPEPALETTLMDTFRRTRSAQDFERLYEAAAPALLDWIRQFVRTRSAGVDPQEVLQDTFVNVYRYARTFRPDARGGFRAWVRTIAANVVRRARSRPRSAGILFADTGGVERSVADARRGPLGSVLDGEEAVGLRASYTLLLQHWAAAFATLKPRDRRALELVELEGLDYTEVGRRLGTGRSNTKMIVFRARKRLHAALSASLTGEPVGTLPGAVAA